VVTNRIEFTIDGEPIAKGRVRSFKLPNGQIRHYTPKETVHYENLVRLFFSHAKPGDWIPHDGPVEMLVIAYFSIPKSWPRWKKRLAESERMKACCRRDWDNVGKVVSDALNEIAYKDDRQVTDPTVMKRYSPRPRVEVTLVFHKPYDKEDTA